jgi:hypothetical protein
MRRNSLDLQMEKRNNFLFASAAGERSRENVISLTMALFDSAIEKSLSKIMIDVRELSGYFGFTDIFFLVKEILLNLRGKGVDQVAVIDVHQTNRRDWFLEHVAQIYDINIRVFTDPEPATKWLIEDDSQYLQ